VSGVGGTHRERPTALLIHNPADPLRRVQHPRRVVDLLHRAVARCELGSLRAYRVAELGYDDCNILIWTNTGRYVVKIFSKFRTPAMCDRYGQILAAVTAAGVRHPKLHPDGSGGPLVHDRETGNRYVVMDHVEGTTFLEVGDHPRPPELRRVMHQIHLIHGVPLVPVHVHDWWAIPQLPVLADEVAPLLEPEDRRRVSAVIATMAEAAALDLAPVFSHGDLTKANVIRSAEHDIAIIDFAVANMYPRVLDLAMVAVNLMHGDPVPLSERPGLLADLYGTHSPLTDAERTALPVYVTAAAAMELLGATREWALKGNRNRETRYLLALGRAALREAVR
jgi:Ser/Thr protein kinase RdoA (MazF antagonist)